MDWPSELSVRLYIHSIKYPWIGGTTFPAPVFLSIPNYKKLMRLWDLIACSVHQVHNEYSWKKYDSTFWKIPSFDCSPIMGYNQCNTSLWGCRRVLNPKLTMSLKEVICLISAETCAGTISQQNTTWALWLCCSPESRCHSEFAWFDAVVAVHLDTNLRSQTTSVQMC